VNKTDNGKNTVKKMVILPDHKMKLNADAFSPSLSSKVHFPVIFMQCSCKPEPHNLATHSLSKSQLKLFENIASQTGFPLFV